MNGSVCTGIPFHLDASKCLTIRECREIFEAHGYRLVKGTFGWTIEHDIPGCCQGFEYYDPLPVKLKSHWYDKRSIQDFAYELSEKETTP